VQATGLIQFQNEEFLEQLLTRLTETFEAPDSPSLVKHMDRGYLHQMMQAIVAFEVEVLSVRHVFKLSQNRDRQSQANIVNRLSGLDADAREIARIMEEKYKLNS
jgi:transcriptional regulator